MRTVLRMGLKKRLFLLLLEYLFCFSILLIILLMNFNDYEEFVFSQKLKELTLYNQSSIGMLP